METSHIILNQGLTFLAISTSLFIVIVGGFLIKLLIDLSKLTKNIDETTTIVKSELEPTFKEFNNALKSINSIAQNADKQVDSISKLIDSLFGIGTSVFNKAKNLSGGIAKGFVKGLVSVIKMFVKK